jgi:integrase
LTGDQEERQRGGLLTDRRSHLPVLKQSLKQAVQWQLLAVNPADPIRPPRVERPNLVKVGPEIAGAVMAGARGTPLEVPVVLGLGGGLRRGEIYGLHWSEIDLDDGVLHVRSSLQANGVFEEPKTEKSRRTVALPAFVLETLRHHKAEQAKRRLGLGEAWHDNDLVCDRGDGRPTDVVAATHAFKRLAKRLGQPMMRFHDMRHGYATVSLAAGVDLKVISEQMGHATYSITADIYADVIPAVRADAAARLHALLAQA